MSKLFKQLLMLSGFYFILSFILNSWQSNFFYYASLSLFGVLVVFIILLFFKKNFVFLEKFDLNNPRVSNYLKAVGVAQYFDIFFGMIPSMFIESNPYYIPPYFKYASMVYLVVLFISLAYATYFNITKYKAKKEKQTDFKTKKSTKITSKQAD